MRFPSFVQIREYPAREGAICNTVSPNDSANYLQLLKELRAQMDLEFPSKHKLLTAAVRVQPFDGTNGKPMSNVAAYVPYFDWICKFTPTMLFLEVTLTVHFLLIRTNIFSLPSLAIMAYDIMGSWSDTTGPNAPFNNPAPPGDPYSFTQAIGAWTSAGWPLDKLVVGTAFYGRSVTASVDMNAQNPITMFVPHTATVPKGGPADTNDVNFYCNEGAVYSGLWKWKEIRGSILTGGPTTPASGWNRYWDNTTQTPWLFRASDKTFLSYDDPQSLKIKVDYARNTGLRGVMLWDMSYDYNAELINVLQGIHCTSNCPVTTTTSVPPVSSITTNVPTTTVGPSTTMPVTTTKVTTTTAAPTTTPGTGACTGVAAWNSATIYAAPGTKVTYGGRLFENKWWTQNEVPSTANTWGVWKDDGAC